MSAANNQERMLQCSICMEEKQQPKALPCLHSFCESCLETAWRHYQRLSKQADHYECPICRNKCKMPKTGIRGLVTDYRHGQLLELFNELKNQADQQRMYTHSGSQRVLARFCCKCKKSGFRICAVMHCQDCAKSYCCDCARKHSKKRAYKWHDIVQIYKEQSPAEQQCIPSAPPLSEIQDSVPRVPTAPTEAEIDFEVFDSSDNEYPLCRRDSGAWCDDFHRGCVKGVESSDDDSLVSSGSDSPASQNRRSRTDSGFGSLSSLRLDDSDFSSSDVSVSPPMMQRHSSPRCSFGAGHVPSRKSGSFTRLLVGALLFPGTK